MLVSFGYRQTKPPKKLYKHICEILHAKLESSQINYGYYISSMERHTKFIALYSTHFIIVTVSAKPPMLACKFWHP